MICANCGTTNENENNFCKNCGHNLKTSPGADQPLFNYAPSKPANSNIDLGYLIIAILIFINICTWTLWNLLSGSILNGRNDIFYKGMRVFTTILSVAQFVVMIVFPKKQVYKIVIGIIAAFVILYDLYYLIQSFMIRY